MKQFFAIALFFVFGAFLYVFMFNDSCPYTEMEVPLTDDIAHAKIVLTKGTSLLSGEDSDYLCLKEMGQIKLKLVDPASATHYKYQIKDLKIDHITPNSGLEFTAVKLISVTKHGLGTIDSGKGPFDHLILRDQNGKLYDVALVYLGVSEFLKAKINTTEITLTPKTKFKK